MGIGQTETGDPEQRVQILPHMLLGQDRLMRGGVALGSKLSKCGRTQAGRSREPTALEPTSNVICAVSIKCIDGALH